MDVLHAELFESVDNVSHEDLRGRGSSRDAYRTLAKDPLRLDLLRLVNQEAGDALTLTQLAEAVGV